MFTSCLLDVYLMFTWYSLPKIHSCHCILVLTHTAMCVMILVFASHWPASTIYFLQTLVLFVCLFVSHLKALLICENKCLLLFLFLLLLLFFFLFLEICFWIVPYFTVVADFFTIIDKDNREALESQHKAALLLRCFPPTTCHSERCS